MFLFHKTYPLIIISQFEIGEPLPEDSVLFPFIIPQYLQLSEFFKSRKILRSVEVGIADDGYCRHHNFVVCITSQIGTTILNSQWEILSPGGTSCSKNVIQ